MNLSYKIYNIIYKIISILLLSLKFPDHVETKIFIKETTPYEDSLRKESETGITRIGLDAFRRNRGADRSEIFFGILRIPRAAVIPLLAVTIAGH